MTNSNLALLTAVNQNTWEYTRSLTETEKISRQNVAIQFCAREKSWNPWNFPNPTLKTINLSKSNAENRLVRANLPRKNPPKWAEEKGTILSTSPTGISVFQNLDGPLNLVMKNCSRSYLTATFTTTSSSKTPILAANRPLDILTSVHRPSKNPKTPKKKKKKKKEDKILPSGLSFPDRIPNNFLPSGLQN
jgi:hypothetical protein